MRQNTRRIKILGVVFVLCPIGGVLLTVASMLIAFQQIGIGHSTTTGNIAEHIVGALV